MSDLRLALGKIIDGSLRTYAVGSFEAPNGGFKFRYRYADEVVNAKLSKSGIGQAPGLAGNLCQRGWLNFFQYLHAPSTS